MDTIDVRIKFHAKPEEVKSVAIMQSLVYSIQDKINADLKTRIFNQFKTPNGFSKLRAEGNLNLKQRENF